MSTFDAEDLTAGTGTGITAHDRARLLRWLAKLPEEEICLSARRSTPCPVMPVPRTRDVGSFAP